MAGPLLSMYLAQRGFQVDIYERRADMRKGGSPGGRSINLALSARGIHALRQVELEQQILAQAIPMRGRMIHAPDGTLTFQPYGKDETEVIYSISRAQLNIALMDAAERTGKVKIHFHTRCLGMDFATGALHLRDERAGREFSLHTKPVIGTDGSASVLRECMREERLTDFTEEYLEYGYKELTIAATEDGRFAMDPHALHIWPRKTFMLIALPNVDGSFTCILFYPFTGKESFETLDTREHVREFFRQQFPDALMLMPSLEENFFANPIGSMVTVRCFPWHVADRMLLLGDASHAIVPFFGQGMNCAFEDCTVFTEYLDSQGVDWKTIFRSFEQSRKPNCDAIAAMAIENFVEMRDLVADPEFLFRKTVELELEKRFPTMFVPRYGMVTFHRIPYAVAMQRGRVQDGILDRLCNGVRRLEEIDWSYAAKLIEADLPPIEHSGSI